MPICKPNELYETIPQLSRIAGLDVGSATVGIAISDPNLTIATARTTLRRGKRFEDLATQIFELLDQAEVGALIIGLPLDLSGKPGPRAQASKAFARNLTKIRDFPLAFWDERMSTNAARRVLLEADLSRKRRGEVIDSSAAAFILQGYLDYLQDYNDRHRTP